MTTLSAGKCIPCEGSTAPLTGDELEQFKARLEAEAPGWEIVKQQKLVKKYKFPDFRAALEFVNKIGAIAETEGHHPDIKFGWGYVEITLSTHAIGGLSENDFVLAAKISSVIKR